MTPVGLTMLLFTIACQIEFPLEQQQEIRIIENAMLAQHQHIEWLQINTILDHPEVHDNVKSYFENAPTNIFL